MKQDMQEPSRLYVRNRNGRYTVATADRVVEAARTVAEQRVQRGQSFSDPALASQYFQDMLGCLEREVFAAAYLDTRHRLIEYVGNPPAH